MNKYTKTILPSGIITLAKTANKRAAEIMYGQCLMHIEDRNTLVSRRIMYCCAIKILERRLRFS